MQSLLQVLASWKPFTALVVGDFMLDQLVYGDAERLSADAPVPILHVKRTESLAGGSANVCLDLMEMRGRVLAFGVVGDDAHALTLRSALSDAGVVTEGLLTDPSRPTTVKQNLIGLAQTRHPQKMFRVDFESRAPLSDVTEQRLLAEITRALPGCDVVCIEDYNKGVCTAALCRGVIEAAQRAGKPVLVDPARLDDYSKYKGASAITPNRTEAQDAVARWRGGVGLGGPDVAGMAEYLRSTLHLECAILTLDRDGALFIDESGVPVSMPTLARRVYDVTGAGDMFLAALAAGRANGCTWRDAVALANVAAGLEVEIFGVQPIPLEKIHHQVLLQQTGTAGKFRTREQLMLEVAANRRDGKRIVLTNGCFDVLHAGHVWLLDQAKSRGDFLIVATNTDEKVREFKGPNRPVNTLEDRVRVLGGLASVDCVCVFEEDTPAELIHQLRPDVLVKGDEYSVDRMPGAAFIKSYGGEIFRVPMMPGKSTTSTLRASGDPRAETSTTVEVQTRFVKDAGT
jgi:D-beta-D-heptose 7-phosphate kinase/D-beta-D-heptose 1-phosphate adenosyltransferase